MISTLSQNLLYAAFFFLPFTFIRLYSNLTISDVLILLSFITLAISSNGKLFLSRTVLLGNVFLLPLIIFSIGFFLSLNNSIIPLDSLTAFMQIAFIFIVAYPVLAEIIKNEKQVKIIAILLIIPGLVISVLMIMLKIIGIDIGVELLADEGWRGRMSYGGMEPNIPGRIILQNIPFIAAFTILAKRLSSKVILLLFLVVQLLSIILTSSRSNMLTFVVGLILFVIFVSKAGKNIKVRHAVYTLLTMSLFTAIFYNINDEFFERPLQRYSTILDASKSASSMERLDVIDQGFNYLNVNPIIGMGLGNSHLHTKVSLHNPILLTWLENGIFGIIGFTSFYLILLFQVYKCYNYKFNGSYIIISLAIITVMMFFGDMFMANSYKRILWLPALLFYAYTKNIRFNKMTI